MTMRRARGDALSLAAYSPSLPKTPPYPLLTCTSATATEKRTKNVFSALVNLSLHTAPKSSIIHRKLSIPCITNNYCVITINIRKRILWCHMLYKIYLITSDQGLRRFQSSHELHLHMNTNPYGTRIILVLTLALQERAVCEKNKARERVFENGNERCCSFSRWDRHTAEK